MNGLEKHLKQFPPRLQRALLSFSHWDTIREIRLRRDLPLSLTSFDGNLFLSESGEIGTMDQAIRCSGDEIRRLVGGFCGGAVYRYLDTLKDGFLVDEDGWRLGLCPRADERLCFLPEALEGANLRLPRSVPSAAFSFLQHFENRPLASTLIFSPPGDGKTTLLRALACALSRGDHGLPLRVAVIDERGELFPPSQENDAGLCDVLSGYEKGRGIEIATRILSPQVILCDEIGGERDAAAILEQGNSGTLFFASCHGTGPRDAGSRPAVRRLLESGIFRWAARLERIPGPRFRSRILWEELS